MRNSELQYVAAVTLAFAQTKRKGCDFPTCVCTMANHSCFLMSKYGPSLYEKSSYLQWEFIWQNLRVKKKPNNGIGMTKLHRFLLGLSEVVGWFTDPACQVCQSTIHRKHGWSSGVCAFQMLSQYHDHFSSCIATDGSPAHFLWAEIWAFDIEIHSFKIHSNLLYKLIVVAVESQWRQTLLTLLTLLSCLFFCLIQVWLFPWPLMEWNDH